MLRPRVKISLADRRASGAESGALKSVGASLATCQILPTHPQLELAAEAANWQHVAAAHRRALESPCEVGEWTAGLWQLGSLVRR